MNKETCPVCQGTGMTRSGYLDCMHPGCDAATRRHEFNTRLEERGLLPGKSFMLDIAWESYRMGREDERKEVK